MIFNNIVWHLNKQNIYVDSNNNKLIFHLKNKMQEKKISKMKNEPLKAEKTIKLKAIKLENERMI